MVLECVVPEVAAAITREVKVPTIGIGAGNECDGQIIVVHDILGMLPGHVPGFVRQYANLFETATAAVQGYADDVTAGTFPPKKPKEHKLAGVYGGTNGDSTPKPDGNTDN